MVTLARKPEPHGRRSSMPQAAAIRTSPWRKRHAETLIVLGTLWLASAAAFADPTATPVIDQRQAHQEHRIQQGVGSGALTKRETATLTARENKITADKTAAKADGKVTPAERTQLRGEERRPSRAIYRKKHNLRTAAPAHARWMP